MTAKISSIEAISAAIDEVVAATQMALELKSDAEDDVLEVSALSVRLDGAPIFKDLNFRVRRGTSFAIVGPNGSGKTMLFRVLLGAVPAEGTFRWARDVRIGYIPQKLDIARDVPITGFDFLRARGRLARSSPDAVAQSLASVGLSSGLAGQAIGKLSGGEFQRLLVAFALMGDPNVLLMDEPTAGVDEPGKRYLTELVHRLQRDRGLTVLEISHDLAEVCRCATMVLCLGREDVRVGPPQEIMTPDLLNKIYGTPVALHSP